MLHKSKVGLTGSLPRDISVVFISKLHDEPGTVQGVRKISLVKYQLLISAIENGSLSAAAEEMGYTQSGVSHMINSLEEEIGVKLVVRNRSGVKLTSTGEVLVPYIKQVLSQEENFRQALSEVTGMLRGKLTIGSFNTISSFYLPEIIMGFQSLYPDITFELKSGTYEQIENWIENRDIDCGFISLPTKKAFKTIPVYKDRLVVVAGKEFRHNFRDSRAVKVEEMEELDHILIDGKTDYDQIRIFQKDLKRLKVKVTVGDSYATIKMVEKNLGIGIIPYNIASQFTETIDIFEMEDRFDRTLAFAYISEAEASPVLRRFIEYMNSENNSASGE